MTEEVIEEFVIEGKSYYEILGVEKDATESQIKKAYLLRARKFHPDKNSASNATEIFQAITNAYDVLRDEEKREIYDVHGEEGLKGGGFPSANANSIFEELIRQMFGGGGHGHHHHHSHFHEQRVRKAASERIKLEVTLEELYCGTTKQVSFNKQIVCNLCSGKGVMKESSKRQCHTCGGRGIVLRSMGMGMAMRTTCPTCKGKKIWIDKSDLCTKCRGKGTCYLKASHDITIKPGMSHLQKITMEGEGHQALNRTNGNLYIIIHQQEHTKFTRRGSHLKMVKDIALLEALSGYSFVVVHLDNRRLKVNSAKDDIISQNSCRAIHNEGMPNLHAPDIRGDLYIVFNVIFPMAKQLPADVCQQLKQCLPKMRKDIQNKQDVEEHVATTKRSFFPLPKKNTQLSSDEEYYGYNNEYDYYDEDDYDDEDDDDDDDDDGYHQHFSHHFHHHNHQHRHHQEDSDDGVECVQQ